MSCSILIPTYNRKKFSELITYNINIQEYKNIKEVIVLYDDEESLDLSNCRYKVKYIKCNRCSIGEKRNKLIKLATSKYCAFMDTDDIYFFNYISSSIYQLRTYNKKITGSGDMLFYFTSNDTTGFCRTAMLHLLNEATIFFERKFVYHNCKFKKNNSGEGINFLTGFENYIIDNDIGNIMCCIEHNGNTVNKKTWIKAGVQLNFIDKIENHLKILSDVKL